MNSDQWSRLSSIAEIVSSVAVLVTLVFLTIEVKQNTQAIEATTRQAALNSDTEFLVSAINNPEIVLAWSKPQLTDEEVVKLNEALILFFRNRENDYVQYRRGVLDAGTWERYSSSLRAILSWQRNVNWWNSFGETFDPEYVIEVNRIISETEVMQDGTLWQDVHREAFGITQ